MSQKVKTVCLCLSVLLLLSASFTVWTFVGRETSQAASIGEATSVSTLPMYMLREYEGKIAVFAFGETTPKEVSDIRVDTLTAYDQENLRCGIPAYSEEQCQRLMEDFD